MDLALSEEQQLLRGVARDFLEKECPDQHVREMESDERGYSPELWSKMADQGWQGLLVPTELGGAGMSFLDMTILVEEFGRVLVPGPFIPTAVAAIALLEAGSDEQKQAYLPKIAAGDTVWTLAFTEPSARFNPEGIQLSAEERDGEYVLNGTKLFIRDSHVADYMVVVARSGGSGAEGISLFIVDARAPGITHTPLETLASDKQNEVKFDGVRVSPDNRMGPAGGAWPVLRRILNKATLLECAYLVGLADRDFEMAIDYSKDRVQFGRPIGSFQAIQHKAANMASDVDASRLILYKAAWSVSEDDPEMQDQVHMAKAWISEATRRVVTQSQMIHGGIGFTMDYKSQLYFRRQKAGELAWGDAEVHRAVIAQSMGI